MCSILVNNVCVLAVWLHMVYVVARWMACSCWHVLLKRWGMAHRLTLPPTRTVWRPRCPSALVRVENFMCFAMHAVCST